MHAGRGGLQPRHGELFCGGVPMRCGLLLPRRGGQHAAERVPRGPLLPRGPGGGHYEPMPRRHTLAGRHRLHLSGRLPPMRGGRMPCNGQHGRQCALVHRRVLLPREHAGFENAGSLPRGLLLRGRAGGGHHKRVPCGLLLPAWLQCPNCLPCGVRLAYGLELLHARDGCCVGSHRRVLLADDVWGSRELPCMRLFVHLGRRLHRSLNQPHGKDVGLYYLPRGIIHPPHYRRGGHSHLCRGLERHGGPTHGGVHQLRCLLRAHDDGAHKLCQRDDDRGRIRSRGRRNVARVLCVLPRGPHRHGRPQRLRRAHASARGCGADDVHRRALLCVCGHLV